MVPGFLIYSVDGSFDFAATCCGEVAYSTANVTRFIQGRARVPFMGLVTTSPATSALSLPVTLGNPFHLWFFETFALVQLAHLVKWFPFTAGFSLSGNC